MPQNRSSKVPEQREDLYIVAKYLHGLVDHVRARGASVAPVLAALQLTEEELREPDREIPHALQDEAFAAAERETGDTNIGLHAGTTNHLMHFGIVGQLALACSNGEELLDLNLRYQRLIGNGVRYALERTADSLALQITSVRDTPRIRHSLEYSLAAQLTLARLLAGEAFVLCGLELTYAAPPDPAEVERVFGCAVSWNCDVARIHLPLAVLALPLATGTAALRPLLEQEAKKHLVARHIAVPHDDAEVRRVTQYIVDRLSTGGPSIEETAAALETSARTLQRRLEQHGLGYREVVDLARREVAERLIVDPSLSLLDVALLLGFAEQSAFSRAFRRWFGAAPREYRAAQR